MLSVKATSFRLYLLGSGITTAPSFVRARKVTQNSTLLNIMMPVLVPGLISDM